MLNYAGDGDEIGVIKIDCFFFEKYLIFRGEFILELTDFFISLWVSLLFMETPGC